MVKIWVENKGQPLNPFIGVVETNFNRLQRASFFPLFSLGTGEGHMLQEKLYYEIKNIDCISHLKIKS